MSSSADIAGGTIHVFIGTKAQYIKTAPLLRLMDQERVPYRLIDTGQHAEISSEMRRALSVREPDLLLGGDRDIATVPRALVWAAGLALRLLSRRRLRSQIFGGVGGVCVVHGDTPSTLLAALMAKRAGLELAHLESGLRSHRFTHPFPEEIIRVLVMRMAGLLFAPEPAAVKNLKDLRVKGRIVATEGNTSIEALRHSAAASSPPAAGPVVVTMHRVENLHSQSRVDLFVETVSEVAATREVRFLMHEPTRVVMERGGRLDRLLSSGVRVGPLVGHAEFVSLLAGAPFVITDGGSIHEECAMLGVPTLLWRDRYEHSLGIGANVLVGRYDRNIIATFLADPDTYRTERSIPEIEPSRQVLTVLLEALESRRVLK